MTNGIPFSILIGKTLTECIGKQGGDKICFKTSDGETYRLYHQEDCCESVTIDDICGELNDLVGSPILQAEENSSRDNPAGFVKNYQESFTWTFYRLATVKGFVVIRWYGESNGYYSESVNFVKVR